MLKAWRNEILCLLATGLVLLLLGMVVGRTGMLLGAGLAAYFSWNLLNLYLLHRWIASSHRFRLPVSLGIWEAIFDGLQGRQLGNRRRRRNLVEQVRQIRDAGEADRLHLRVRGGWKRGIERPKGAIGNQEREQVEAPVVGQLRREEAGEVAARRDESRERARLAEPPRLARDQLYSTK